MSEEFDQVNLNFNKTKSTKFFLFKFNYLLITPRDSCTEPRKPSSNGTKISSRSETIIICGCPKVFYLKVKVFKLNLALNKIENNGLSQLIK